MSRSIFVREFGGTDKLELREFDPGPPGPGQVRIAVHAIGVGFADVLVTEGGYQLKPDLPFVPGAEYAGIVEAVGEGVTAYHVGQKVCGASFIGAYGQTVLMAEGQVMPMPQGASYEEAAVFRVSYATSYYALKQRGALKAGETLLVLGAGGAVGYAAIQLGKVLGATVIASASTEEKRALALKAGADTVVDARSETWRDDVKAANGGKPVNVVVDPVGGAQTEAAFRSLAWNGRLLVVGFAEGTIPRIAANLALVKGAAMIGVDVRQFREKEPAESGKNLAELGEFYAAGKLNPPVGKVFALEDFREAFTAARHGQVVGRVVIAMR